MEFYVGDRVRAIERRLIAKVGESNVGTVAIVAGQIGVVWDEKFCGHTLSQHGQRHCENGHGWWCIPQHITLVGAEEDNDYDLTPATDEELSLLYS